MRLTELKKVELLVKNGMNTNKVEFENCGFIIESGFILIISDLEEFVQKGKIFNLNDVSEYKITKK